MEIIPDAKINVEAISKRIIVRIPSSPPLSKTYITFLASNYGRVLGGRVLYSCCAEAYNGGWSILLVGKNHYAWLE